MSNKIPTFIHYINENSIYSKIGFGVKFIIFVLISTFALINSLYIISLSVALIFLILPFTTNYFKYNKKPILFLVYAIFIFSLFWIFFSKIGGETIYFIWPWGTYFSNLTIEFMFVAIGKWSLIYSTGLFFMIVTTENELINFLEWIKFPEKWIISITIAFNTISFSLKDIEILDISFRSRDFNKNKLKNKVLKIYYAATSLLVQNLFRIELLNQSYTLRSK
jgi:energy-coupling factor transporter transmembrane protein EcfT